MNTPLSPRLKVTDGDSGRNAKVRLRITAGNRNGMFRINPVSGVMYVARPLDRERRSSYTFTVSALDQVHIHNFIPVCFFVRKSLICLKCKFHDYGTDTILLYSFQQIESSWFQTLEGLYELTQRPLRAHDVTL